MKVNVVHCHPVHRVFSSAHGISVEPQLAHAAKKAVLASLAYQHVATPCDVELIFCGENEIQSLNRENRNVDSVTDVLSFPMLGLVPGEDPGEAAAADDYSHGHAGLGSIVICVPRALEQAEEYGHGARREFAFLAAHSTLHLLGYDHGDEREGPMFELQKKILNSAGFKKND